MKCKWYFERDYACANSKCPYGGDTCPTSEHPEVCKYAEEKPKPELNAEELVTALRLCAGATCEACPYHEDVSCSTMLMLDVFACIEALEAEREGKSHE